MKEEEEEEEESELVFVVVLVVSVRIQYSVTVNSVLEISWLDEVMRIYLLSVGQCNESALVHQRFVTK